MASIISAGTTSATALNMSADTSGVLQLASNNGTVALTVDTSQNVSVGASTQSTKFEVNTGVGGTQSIATIRSGNVVMRIGTTDIGNGEIFYNAYPNSNSSAPSAYIWEGGGTQLMKLQNTGVLQFNSGYGSVANAYGCRAWVNFNGQGTVAIRASGNVSSITDNSTGNYEINFATAMPDTNYCAVGSKGNITATHVLPGVNIYSNSINYATFQVYDSGGTFQDSAMNFVAIFR